MLNGYVSKNINSQQNSKNNLTGIKASLLDIRKRTAICTLHHPATTCIT
jgi:hypothetical protein